MNRELVIAHCNESLVWLDHLEGWTPRIYEKGCGARGPRLPNVGREAHTYLHHIVQNYDRLADWTAFVQGNPLDHLGDPGSALRRVDDSPGTSGFVDLGRVILVDDQTGAPHHSGIAPGRLYERLFSRTSPEFLAFRAGANFAVSRATIRQRTRSFYERARALSLERYAAWEFERLWPLIFPARGRSRGIVTACDAGAFLDGSFLLESLSRVSSLPIELFDLGLTERQRQWCRRLEHVELRTLPQLTARAGRIQTVPMWQTWLKPFYLLGSRFDQSLWIDADCVVLSDPTEAFERMARSPLLMEDTSGANVANRASLREVFPTGRSGTERPARVNAGVVGLDLTRDRELLTTWAWAVQWVGRNLRYRNRFRWYDQGALSWALQRRAEEQLVSADVSWNTPFLSRGANPLLEVTRSGTTLTQWLRIRFPTAGLIHFLGDYKLSEKLRAAIRV